MNTCTNCEREIASRELTNNKLCPRCQREYDNYTDYIQEEEDAVEEYKKPNLFVSSMAEQ